MLSVDTSQAIAKTWAAINNSESHTGGSLATSMLCLGGYTTFSTVNGRVGVMRGNSRLGDQLCLFDGAPLYYVVRPVDGTSENKYILTGEAYIFSCMNGEVEALNLEGEEITLV